MSVLGLLARLDPRSWSTRSAPTSIVRRGSTERRAMVIKSTAEIVGALDDPSWALSGLSQSRVTSSVWVYACSAIIARTLASVPLIVMVNGEPSPDHGLQKLIDRPAPGWTRARFMQATSFYLSLVGESFWEKKRAPIAGPSDMIAGVPRPAQLWVAGTETWTTNGAVGTPITVSFRRATGETLAPSEVMRSLFVLPGDDFNGLAPIVPSSREVATDQAAAEWQCTAFKNRAVPDGIFKISGIVSDAQYDEAEARLEAAWMGGANAHKPMVLGGEVEWIDLAKSAVEMDFLNGRKLTRETICGAYGVPPVLVGILDRATFSNFQQANRAFWEFTVMPILEQLVDLMNIELAPEWGEGVEVVPDLTGVDALVPRFSERLDVAAKLWSLGVPMEQINRRLNLRLESFAGWRQGYVPTGVALQGITGTDEP